MKKIIALFLSLALLLSFSSCFEATPKKFSKEGITLTLSTAFRETAYEGYTVCYDSPEVAVFVLKEPFSLAEGFEDLTLEQYAELVHQNNASKSPAEIAVLDGITTMEYSFFNESKNTTFKYFATMFKGPDAFWLVQFACAEDNYEENKDSFLTWAKSVSFDS